ncbi:MAG: mechanosensitive ion channel family protein [Shimia sp.]
MENLPPFAATAIEYGRRGVDIAAEWLLSPAAWSQFAILIAAYLLAVIVARWLSARLERWLRPIAEGPRIFAPALKFLLLFLPILMPLLAFAFTAIGEQATAAIFGSGAVLAFGKRVFLFIGARILVNDVFYDPALKAMGRFLLIPIAALYALGILDDAQALLAGIMVELGNIQFSLLAVARGVIAGSIIFWLGSWSNRQSSGYIQSQELRPSVRELATKAIEFSIFAIAFLLLMNIVGIDLTALAVLGGAVGVGLGFGLQKIASNFISGVILLLEGDITVGDFVELDGGEAGRIVRMTARAAIMETFDGKWIVVPNEDFIVTRVVNWSDSGSANRYEAPFQVSYDTDINVVPRIVQDAVSGHPAVLQEPFPPDCELRGFGENGIEFAVEFWVNGIDDGPNRFVSDVLFIVWNALREEGIEIPAPRRDLRVMGEVRARVR